VEQLVAEPEPPAAQPEPEAALPAVEAAAEADAEAAAEPEPPAAEPEPPAAEPEPEAAEPEEEAAGTQPEAAKPLMEMTTRDLSRTKIADLRQLCSTHGIEMKGDEGHAKLESMLQGYQRAHRTPASTPAKAFFAGEKQ